MFSWKTGKCLNVLKRIGGWWVNINVVKRREDCLKVTERVGN